MSAGISSLIGSGAHPVENMAKRTVNPLDTAHLNKLNEWWTALEQHRYWKQREFELRQAIVFGAVPPETLEGTTNFDLGAGYTLKAKKVMNYTATNENNAAQLLGDALVPIDPSLRQHLITWKPDLSVSTYKKSILPLLSNPELARLVSAAIIIKPGAPELEVVPPKEKA